MADTKFMYLFRGGAPAASPEQMQQSMQVWRTWMKGLAETGNLIGGEPLDRGGVTVRGKSRVLTDGPYAEAKDIVGGYLIVTAKDLAHATELAQGCPILADDGTVEVRAIHSM